jgi:glycosyltransferase involved in cell wall biosynthesis
LSTGKKKTLVFFDCTIHFGGSNQSTLLMIREVQKSCDVIVLDAYGICREYHDAMKRWRINNRIALPNPKYWYIGGSNPLTRTARVLASGFEMVLLIRRLEQEIEDIQPSVVWTNSQKGFFFISHAVGRTVPIVYYARGEGMYPTWYNRMKWRHVPLLIANSESGLSKIRSSPYQPDSMAVIPNGIDTDETVKLASTKASDVPLASSLCLIFPGTLNENKKQDTAIRGLAKYVHRGGDARLWLCGDCLEGVLNEYARSLSPLADALNVADRVSFLGWRDDVLAIMAQADVVVLTSLSEGMPRVILEAMALKKPTIATRVGGIPEVVRDGVDGILIEPDDSEGFAAAVKKLADPKLREEMGQAGFERVKSGFDIEYTATQFLEAISKAC